MDNRIASSTHLFAEKAIFKLHAKLEKTVNSPNVSPYFSTSLAGVQPELNNQEDLLPLEIAEFIAKNCMITINFQLKDFITFTTPKLESFAKKCLTHCDQTMVKNRQASEVSLYKGISNDIHTYAKQASPKYAALVLKNDDMPHPGGAPEFGQSYFICNPETAKKTATMVVRDGSHAFMGPMTGKVSKGSPIPFGEFQRLELNKASIKNIQSQIRATNSLRPTKSLKPTKGAVSLSSLGEKTQDTILEDEEIEVHFHTNFHLSSKNIRVIMISTKEFSALTTNERSILLGKLEQLKKFDVNALFIETGSPVLTELNELATT
jgi:hypothetical protein